MEITTPRLHLREFSLDDLASTHAYAADVETTRHTLFGPNAERDTREFLSAMQEAQRATPRVTYDMAVVLTSNGTHIGGIGLRVHGPQADMGYVFHKDYWGKGYAPEAGRAMLDFAFGTLRLHRVYATCDIANLASARVLEKIGLQREGHLRKNAMMKGKWRDSFLYAILDEEHARIPA